MVASSLHAPAGRAFGQPPLPSLAEMPACGQFPSSAFFRSFWKVIPSINSCVPEV